MEQIPVLRFISNPFPGYISSGKVVYGPDQKHPERIFSTFVAMFIEEGILYFTEGDHKYSLTAGQWFIQIPGIRHYGHQAAGVNTVFHFVHFMPQGDWQIEINPSMDGQDTFFTKQLDSGDGVRLPKYELKLPMRGTYFPNSDWVKYFHELHHNPLSDRGGLHRQASFLKLLERLIAFGSESRTANQSIQHVVDYIQEHYSEPITVSELAARFHFSTDYLTRQIKQITGMAPFSLITHYRMNKAKHLLVHTNNSIQQIGLDSGYLDIAVFSRMFKKSIGLSPHKYRKIQWGNR